MPWAKASFKGNDVWVEVGPDGSPRAQGPLVGIRYKADEGAKIYRARAESIEVRGAPEELPSGASLEAGLGASGASGTPAAGASSGAGARGKSGRGSGFGSAKTRTEGQAQAARQDLKARMAALSPETTLVFTDGACTGNPGPAGSGAVVRRPDGTRAERHLALGQGTNNIAELSAIGLALDLLDEAGVAADAPVVIFTDSDYSNGVLTRGWKAKANVELIAGLKARLRKWKALDIQWVPGHAGVPENERADELARRGSTESRGRR